MAGDDIAELPAEPATPSRFSSRRGKFKNGTWYCDCSPALPCLFLTASKSKDKTNNGKQFYSCQKDKKTANSCGFFMWADQARSREINYLMTNRKSELVQSQLQFPSTQAGDGGEHGGGSSTGKKRLKQATLDNIAIRTRSSHRLRSAAAAAAAAGGGSGSGSETASGSSRDEEAGSSTRATAYSSPHQTRSAESLGASSSHTASKGTLQPSSRQQQRRSEKQAESQLGTKRKAPANDDFSDFSDGEVKELAAIEQRSGGSSWTGSTVRTRDAFATPNVTGGRSIFAAHYRDDGQGGVAGAVTTPNTERSVRRVLFTSDAQSSKDGGSNRHHGLDTPPNTGKRQRNTAGGAYTPSVPQRHAQTPTSLSRSMMSNTTPGTSFSSDLGAGSQSPADITADVLDILRSQKINPAVLDEVKGALDSFSRRTAGYERGRDRSRREIQRQQKRIAELEQRAAALENSRELDRAALKRVQGMEE